MGKTLFAGHALLRVNAKQVSHEAKLNVVEQMSVPRVQTNWRAVEGERRIRVRRVAKEQLQLLRRETAEHLLNATQLINVRVAGEERLSVQALAHQAADRPHVHANAVRTVHESRWVPLAWERRAKQELWRAVPPRRHLVRQDVIRIRPRRALVCRARVRAERPCESKVAQLHLQNDANAVASVEQSSGVYVVRCVGNALRDE